MLLFSTLLFHIRCLRTSSDNSPRVVGCSLTCSTVSGVEISSPLRIMERWVSTSASWSEFRPRSSDVRLRAADTKRLVQTALKQSVSQPGAWTVRVHFPTWLGGDLSPSSRHELNVPCMEDPCQEAQDLPDVLLRELHCLHGVLKTQEEETTQKALSMSPSCSVAHGPSWFPVIVGSRLKHSVEMNYFLSGCFKGLDANQYIWFGAKRLKMFSCLMNNWSNVPSSEIQRM